MDACFSKRWLHAALACGILQAAALSAADCDQSGVDDFVEIRDGRSADCNQNGIPDSCEIREVNYGLEARQTLPLAGPAGALALADVDGDGVDEIVLIQNQEALEVRFRDGAGGIAAAPEIRVGIATGAADLAAADLDGDGDEEVAVAHGSGVAVASFAGRAIEPVEHLVLNAAVRSVAAGEIDGAGGRELAAALGAELAILRFDGRAVVVADSLPLGSRPRQVLLADFDGERGDDLAAINVDRNVSIFLNRGRGQFGAPRNFFAGGLPQAAAAVDADGDGRSDLAVAVVSPSSLALYLSRGDGFAEPIRRDLPARPSDLGSADLDGDGAPDWIVALGPTGLAYALGGGGALTAFLPIEVRPAQWLEVVDLDGDGVDEIALAEFDAGALAVYARAPAAIAEDCNGDLIPDDCQRAERDCNGNLALDDCEIASGQAADCDGDGVLDACESDCDRNQRPDDCDVASGAAPDCNGNGVPDACDVETIIDLRATELPSAFSQPPDLAWVDIEGDGDLDLITMDGRQPLLWRSMDGRLEQTLSIDGVPPNRLWAGGDFDGDGDGDLIAVDAAAPALILGLNLGNGRFRIEPIGLPPSTAFVDPRLLAADLDGDGAADGALALETAGPDGPGAELLIFFGLGGVERSAAVGIPFERRPDSRHAGDFDGDGLADLALVESGGRGLTLLLHEGPRAFRAGGRWTAGASIRHVAVGDIDADGNADVAATFAGAPGVEALFGDGKGGVRERRALPARAIGGFPAIADFDLDGGKDVGVIFGNTPPEPVLGTILEAYLRAPAGDFAAVGERLLLRALLPRSLLVGGGGDALILAGLEIGSRSGRVFIVANRSVPAASFDLDEDGRPDECAVRAFHRGDADGDGRLGVTDAIRVLDFLFRGGAAPGCRESADLDNDGAIRVNDPVFALNHVFLGGPPPPPPGPPGAACGADPDPPGAPADLGCEAYPPCE
jgi:hypothetical protein